jgi:hypothetical protein
MHASSSCFLLPNIICYILYINLAIFGLEMQKWYVVLEGKVLGVYEEWENYL